MRLEQSCSCAINAVVEHRLDGEPFSVVVGSVLLDKHPDPSLRRPRPFWGILESLQGERGALLESLRQMLAGAEEALTILRDTDSPNGDPSHPEASRWLLAPLSTHSRAPCRPSCACLPLACPRRWPRGSTAIQPNVSC